MAGVTFSTSIGGDGSTVTDDNDPNTGLGNGGHRVRFVPALKQLVAIAAYVIAQALSYANSAAASAATALNAPGTQASTTTNLTVGNTGNLNFVVQTGKNFAVGQSVSIASAANPATLRIVGIITAYNSGTGAITVAVSSGTGSGNFADGIVALAADSSNTAQLQALTARVATLENAVAYDGEDGYSF